MADWKKLKKEIDDENARTVEEAPEDVLRVYKYEMVRNTQAGTGHNIMGVWFEGATASRYVGAYYIYNIIKLAMDPSFTLDHIKELVNELLPKCVGTAQLCGMEVLGKFSFETIACINEMDNREDILALLNSLYLYGSSMNAWIHHFMKWGNGQAFLIKSKEDCEAIGRLAYKCFIPEVQ